ncbi:TetR/AcrR family transcriptional regulator [Dactylosporangium sp. AC04546]|uniref:TetR/AcrR family transcriptional regulator n=1 Tax=Dactylosporangium sp. AC04546 TaxID=2862460 RepID=UPI001EDCFE17|nr:TetR/AcrR family transcriptional regulator [Dactylosporangium sp. AC04546]WVK84787.1 TetR/AcrR family transcriptional regulator [Dactylosporangium sp. AC04546]
MKATSLRARVRAEMIDEIKEIARQQLATEGANLSLRAVARDLGMVSSAVYRYFASRDDLLTALILDAYNALGSTVEQAEAQVPREALHARWMAMCTAVRTWAVAHPHEYALIYGSPVPGYRAPQDTVAAATRAATVLGTIVQDGFVSGAIPDNDDPLPGPEVERDIRRISEAIAPDAPLRVVARALSAWVMLFGQVSFEIFGQLQNTVTTPAAFFDHQMQAQARYIGIPMTKP